MSALTLRDALRTLREIRATGEGAVLTTVVRGDVSTGPVAGGRMLVSEDGTRVGSLHPDLDDVVGADALDCLAQRRSRTWSYHLAGVDTVRVGVRGGDIDVYFEVSGRSPQLVIVGAGHIAVPLARVGSILSFEIIVIDDREEYARRDRFPDADTILVGPYPTMLSSVRLHSESYVVLVTRGHVHDQACLEQVLDAGIAYVGMIGSKRRVRTVLRHIEEKGVDPARLKRVHAPIGLAIGSQTPAEIAVAIAAEIINLRRGGAAPSLSLAELRRG